MKTETQLLMTFLLYNLKSRSHISSIPVDNACLLYYILMEREIDVTHIISQEIKFVSYSGHPLGTNLPASLIYHGLIMGLCSREGVKISSMVHLTIRSVVNEEYMVLHYFPRLVGDGAPRPGVMAPPAGPICYNEHMTCM